MFGRQRISSLQPISKPSAAPPDDLAIIRTFPHEKAAIGPTPIRVLSWQTEPRSKTITPRLDYETIARTQPAKKEPLPKGSWRHRSKFRSGGSSRMRFLQRAASTTSSPSSGSLRKLGIATWPSKWSRKATTKINISTVLPESPPKRLGSPTRTLSSLVDAPDPHDISVQYFGSSSADQSGNEESKPGAAAVWNTASEDSSDSDASVLPVNSDPHNLKRVEQQRLLAYYRLTGCEYEENHGVMGDLRADNFKQGAQVVSAEEELQHGALILTREGHLSIISEHRSEYESAVDHAYNANADTGSELAAETDISSEDEAFSKFLRTCAENAGSPPPIPKKSPSRRLRNFGGFKKDRVYGLASAEENNQRLSLSSHEPEIIAPTPLSPSLPHFHTIEEAEAYRRAQASKRTSPSSHALAKRDDDACGHKTSQLPDISRDSISNYSASISNALTSARTSSTSLSPTEKARLRPEPLNLRSLARSSTSRSSLYAPPPPLPPPSPSLPPAPPQSEDGDSNGVGAVIAFNTHESSAHETRSTDGDSVQLHFENPGPGPGPGTSTDTDPSLLKIQSNSSSSESNKESIHETGLPYGTAPQGQSSAEKNSRSQLQSQSQSLDPDVKERHDWYGREVRLRVERIRRALRTKSFYPSGSV